MPSVLMVVMLELYVILVYACACFLLYGRRGDDLDGPFQELDWSFINLFALSTTVNNPDIWLPMYAYILKIRSGGVLIENKLQEHYRVAHC